MIFFYQGPNQLFYTIEASQPLQPADHEKLSWLLGNATQRNEEALEGYFIGPRKEMITPWSTNAVEITQNMGIDNIVRIEQFQQVENKDTQYDPMLQALYEGLNQHSLTIDRKPEPIRYIDDIASYNEQEGLALSPQEIEYLNQVSKNIGRKLTDSEVFGFSQVNSEHCRHKIFNGKFIIDGEEQRKSLFQLIKNTSTVNPNKLVSAYKDNVAFVSGPWVMQFAPARQDQPDYFELKEFESVLSLKAETHNFPTTVEPFNGAATGTGGEIRDRMAGGKAAIPLAGTAVYMTSYPRLEAGRTWENNTQPRKWLYQTPQQILTKASNGASDFGNKFGQPLICGSVLTFEHFENDKKFGFDKVVMLAGGIGFSKKSDSIKDKPTEGEKIVVMGGDNYRIGMGGGAVSSVATGEYKNLIELNAVQRANPEMQKRVYNAIRAMSESEENPIVSIHDHGAGGHLNCLSELIERTGGVIEMDELPVGDPTLSAKEIIGNESQERMGLLIAEKDLDWLKMVAARERAPFYVVGSTTGDMKLCFTSKDGTNPIDLKLEHMFGSAPVTVLEDSSQSPVYPELQYDGQKIEEYLEKVLQLEAVACKDWLTNKVDRSVTGKVAKQQTTGAIQLPLNNLGVTTVDYSTKKGVATSIGHAPVAALIDPAAGSVLSIAEALTNIIWAPLETGIRGISLSANWMWPAKNTGENYRLYQAVQAASDFAIDLNINIPTGKDSLSMTQKYPDGDVVYSPGTVIISAMSEVKDVNKVISPNLVDEADSALIYVDLSSDEFHLGGSSFAQALNQLGADTPTVKNPSYFKKAFNAIQNLIEEEKILSGHDISAGGMVTALLEMCFPSNQLGLDIDLSELEETDLVKILFSENPGVIMQIKEKHFVTDFLTKKGVKVLNIGKMIKMPELKIKHQQQQLILKVQQLRDTWYKTSYLLDQKQTAADLARLRFDNYKKQELLYHFPGNFTGKSFQYGINFSRQEKTGIKGAIIREKGVNGDREMAFVMHLAGFDVKDVHMTDLISGRETLEDINFIVFTGGFSNSDVLGSAKGWAGAFLYNEKAKSALDRFYQRDDTLSLGVCNGCQLMVALNLITPEHQEAPKMLHNQSEKFESAFLNVDVLENDNVLLSSLAGSRLGIWIAHGEGRFQLPQEESSYKIPLKWSYDQYPGNPNGSDYNTAAISSADGRHLAMMPHLERSFIPYHWPHYPRYRDKDEVTPWIEAFINAREWIKDRK